MGDFDCLLGCMAITAGVFAVTCWLYAIGCASYLTNIWTMGRWRVGYERVQEGEISTLYSLFRDWDTNPFTDAVVTGEGYCPTSHPEDFVYDMWPGTVGHCDCLQERQPGQERDYHLRACQGKEP